MATERGVNAESNLVPRLPTLFSVTICSPSCPDLAFNPEGPAGRKLFCQLPKGMAQGKSALQVQKYPSAWRAAGAQERIHQRCCAASGVLWCLYKPKGSTEGRNTRFYLHERLSQSKKQKRNQSFSSFTVITFQHQSVYVLLNFYDTLKLIWTDKHQSPSPESWNWPFYTPFFLNDFTHSGSFQECVSMPAFCQPPYFFLCSHNLTRITYFWSLLMTHELWKFIWNYFFGHNITSLSKIFVRLIYLPEIIKYFLKTILKKFFLLVKQRSAKKKLN